MRKKKQMKTTEKLYMKQNRMSIPLNRIKQSHEVHFAIDSFTVTFFVVVFGISFCFVLFQFIRFLFVFINIFFLSGLHEHKDCVHTTRQCQSD